MNAYRAQLAETYRSELDALTIQFGRTAQIVDTGGGCMAIEVIVGEVSGTRNPLQMIITTRDADLAEDRDDILHWYACLYDAVEGGEALADGHDLETFDAACDLALSHLRDGVLPSEDLCACLLVPDLDQ